MAVPAASDPTPSWSSLHSKSPRISYVSNHASLVPRLPLPRACPPRLAHRTALSWQTGFLITGQIPAALIAAQPPLSRANGFARPRQLPRSQPACTRLIFFCIPEAVCFPLPSGHHWATCISCHFSGIRVLPKELLRRIVETHSHSGEPESAKWRNGRRTRLKIGRGNPCGFDSHLGHSRSYPFSTLHRRRV